MALNVDIPVSGHIVATTEKAWEYEDETTGKIRRGAGRKVWVSMHPNKDPQVIKLGDKDPAHQAWWDQIVNAGRFAGIEGSAAVVQFGKQEASLVFTEIDALTSVTVK